MKEKQKSEKVLTISTADELQTLVDTPLECRFDLLVGGQVRKVAVQVTRLSGHTQERVRKLRRAAQPKWNEARKDYDVTDPTYQELRDTNERKARAYIIYSHCPVVAAKKPGLTSEEDIAKFVQSLWSENILELVSLTIQGGGLDIENRVNFTSTPLSED